MTEDKLPEHQRSEAPDRPHHEPNDMPPSGLERAPSDDRAADERDTGAAYLNEITPETGPATLEPPEAGFDRAETSVPPDDADDRDD